MGRKAKCVVLTCGAIATGLLMSASASANFPGANGRIAFVHLSGAMGGSQDIFTMSPRGRHRVQLTQGPADDAFPNYSPDGERIVFTRGAAGSAGVGQAWIMNQDGSGQKQLTHGSPTVESTTFSPNGRRIAFTRGDGGSTQLWTMKVDGTDQTQLTFPGPNGDHVHGPTYSPDEMPFRTTEPPACQDWTRLLSLLASNWKSYPWRKMWRKLRRSFSKGPVASGSTAGRIFGIATNILTMSSRCQRPGVDYMILKRPRDLIETILKGVVNVVQGVGDGRARGYGASGSRLSSSGSKRRMASMSRRITAARLARAPESGPLINQKTPARNLALECFIGLLPTDQIGRQLQRFIQAAQARS